MQPRGHLSPSLGSWYTPRSGFACGWYTLFCLILSGWVGFGLNRPIPALAFAGPDGSDRLFCLANAQPGFPLGTRARRIPHPHGDDQMTVADQVPLTGGAPCPLTVTAYQNGVLLRWHTRWILDNLGYHLYREVGGVRIRVTPSLVAGTAFATRHSPPRATGKSYMWWDSKGTRDVTYWLQAIDLDYKQTWHGPCDPNEAAAVLPKILCSPMLPRLGTTHNPGIPISCPNSR